MLPFSEAAAGALLSLEASARQARALRYTTSVQREFLAQHLQQCLLQWQCQWGIANGGDMALPATPVHCHAFTNSAAASLAGHSWKPLNPCAQEQGIWWSLSAPQSSANARTAGGRPRAAGAILLAALSQAWFGEAVNLQQEWRPRVTASIPVAPADMPGALGPREEPVLHPEAGIAAELVFAAWADWCARLGLQSGVAAQFGADVADRSILNDADALATEALPASLMHNWSGALYLTLPWYGQTLLLLLSGAAAAHFLQRQPDRSGASASTPPKSAALTPLWGALAGQTMTVEVKLAPLEIALGSLTSLQVGDVLRTSHTLDQPLIVQLGAGATGVAEEATLCDGFLGRQEGRRAVELI